MKKCIAFLFAIFIFFNCFSQIKFQKIYKGNGGDDQINAIIVKPDSTYILSGNSTTMAGNEDFGMLNINKQGSIIWSKIYGGGSQDIFFKSCPTNDNGYLLCGFTISFGSGAWDSYLIKTNDIGDTIWTKAIGNNYFNVATNAIQLSNKDYVILNLQDMGGVIYDPYLTKLDSAGNLLWNKFYSAPNNDDLSKILLTNDNGFIISGSTKSFGMGDYDTYIIKTDSLGNFQWAKTYGGSQVEGGASIIKCSDGYLIANGTKSFGQGGADVYVLKIDFNGNILWAKTYGTATDEYAVNIIGTDDKGYIMAGIYGQITGTNRDVMIVKIDSIGNFQWAKRYGDTSHDFANAIAQADDAGYLVGGTSVSFGGWGAYFIKTDSLGKSGCYEQNLNLITQDITSLLTVTNPIPTVYSDTTIKAKNTQTIVTNGGIIADTICYSVVGIDEINKTENEVNIYPNPNNGIFSFAYKLKPNEKGVIQIYDITGKLIKSYQLSATDNILNINNTELNAGTYLYKYLINGSVSKVDKLIIIK